MRHLRSYRFHGEGDMSYSTYSMENSSKKSFGPDRETATTSAERRRIGRIVHDERGNKTVDWHDAPSNYKRTVLEVESEQHGLAIQKAPRTFDPYGRATPVEQPPKNTESRKDLRKLSEWIKMMRELEERKLKGEVG
jgi:hypothetical protein